MTALQRSVRIGDPLAPIIAWGYVLFLLTLLGLVLTAAGMFFSHASKTGSLDPSSLYLLVGMVLVIAVASLPLVRIAGRVHRIRVAGEGVWKLYSPLGNLRGELPATERRSVVVIPFRQTEWLPDGTPIGQRRRILLRIEREGGGTLLGFSSEGPELLESLGYRLAPGQLQVLGQGELRVPPHDWVGGEPRFEA